MSECEHEDKGTVPYIELKGRQTDSHGGKPAHHHHQPSLHPRAVRGGGLGHGDL